MLLVAGLGAAASGLLGAQSTATSLLLPELPLALIPLVCIYVDLLSLDLTLRIVVITRYLCLEHARSNEPTVTGYAAFVNAEADQMSCVPTIKQTLGILKKAILNWFRRTDRPSAYAFGFFAQGLCTSVLSVGVFVWALSIPPSPQRDVVFIAAVGGLVVTVWSYLAYKRRTVAIGALKLPAHEGQ